MFRINKQIFKYVKTDSILIQSNIRCLAAGEISAEIRVSIGREEDKTHNESAKSEYNIDVYEGKTLKVFKYKLIGFSALTRNETNQKFVKSVLSKGYSTEVNNAIFDIPRIVYKIQEIAKKN